MPLVNSSLDLQYNYNQGGPSMKSDVKTSKSDPLKGKLVESPVKSHYNGDPISTKRDK